MKDYEIRKAAFDWLTRQVDIHGDVLPWALLAPGFQYRREQIRFLGPQGIFKPRLMDMPLSLCTSLSGPYDDSFGADGLLRYRYRGCLEALGSE